MTAPSGTPYTVFKGYNVTLARFQALEDAIEWAIAHKAVSICRNGRTVWVAEEPPTYFPELPFPPIDP